MDFVILKEGDFIGGEFSYDFYHPEMLRVAIVDFGECSEIKTIFENDYAKVFFKSKDVGQDSEEVFQEFGNYVLGLMKGDTDEK